jgi:hypothetical protein
MNEMNEQMIQLITDVVTMIKKETDSLPVDERIRRLMYTFITVKGDPQLIKLGEINAQVYGMMYGIDLDYCKKIYNNNQEFTVLRQLGVDEKTIANDLIRFGEKFLDATKMMSEKVNEING